MLCETKFKEMENTIQIFKGDPACMLFFDAR